MSMNYSFRSYACVLFLVHFIIFRCSPDVLAIILVGATMVTVLIDYLYRFLKW